MNAGFTCVWEFEVAEGRMDAFLRHYGAAGTWVALFRRAPGYRGTQLLRDRANPCRFLTVDAWDGSECYEAFRQSFAAEYDALDRECEGLTACETLIGHFDATEGVP